MVIEIDMRNIFVIFFMLVVASACADVNPDLTQILSSARSFHNAKAEDVECLHPEGGVNKGVLPDYIRGLLSRSLGEVYLKVCSEGGAWDVRFNDDAPSNSSKIEKIGVVTNSNFSVMQLNARSIVVRAKYDHACSFKECGNYTDYRFIKEDGVWRIDDIEIGLRADHMGDSSWRENYSSLKKKLKSSISPSH